MAGGKTHARASRVCTNAVRQAGLCYTDSTYSFDGYMDFFRCSSGVDVTGEYIEYMLHG